MELKKTFTDGLGREWTVEMNLPNARRMKEITGISLDHLVPAINEKKQDPQALMSLQEFVGDPFRVFDAFYALVKPKADERKLSKEDVENGLSNDEFVVKMTTALLGAIHDFFRLDPKRQAILRNIVRLGEKTAKETAAKMDQVIQEQMDKIDFNAIIDAKPGTSDGLPVEGQSEASKSSATV